MEKLWMHSVKVEDIPLAVVIMMTTNGMSSTFLEGIQSFCYFDLSRVVTENAGVHTDILEVY